MSAVNDFNRPLHRFLWTLIVLVIAGLTAALAFRSFRHTLRSAESESASSHLPKIAPVGSFLMHDAGGHEVTDQTLLGKIWVAQFFFTECPGPCPAVSHQLTGLQAMVAKTENVRLVSISIDPENDTPQALTDYAHRMGADPKRWLFLAGTPEMTQQLVARDFMIGFKENPKDLQATQGRFIHSTKVALVDGEGIIRAYYDGLDIETPQHLLTDITALMREEDIH